MELIARAAPDGYNIGYGTSAGLAINRSLLAKLPYDVERDFRMVALMGYQPNLLAIASPSLKEKVSVFGYEVAGGTPEHFTEYVKQEAAKWVDVIKRSGVKVD